MRDLATLEALRDNVKTWFENEFATPFNSDLIAGRLAAMCEIRLENFLKKRVGHLSDADLMNFTRLLVEDGKKV